MPMFNGVKTWGVEEKEGKKNILPAFYKMIMIIKYNKEYYSIKNIVKVLKWNISTWRVQNIEQGNY